MQHQGWCNWPGIPDTHRITFGSEAYRGNMKTIPDDFFFPDNDLLSADRNGTEQKQDENTKSHQLLIL